MGREKWGIKSRDGFVHICHDKEDAKRDVKLLKGTLVRKVEPVWEEVEDDGR